MNKITGKSVQIFVAGGLAIMGFRSLAWTPYYLFDLPTAAVANFVLSGVELLIGIAILVGREQALTWARVYLLFDICLEIVATCLSEFRILPRPPHLSWRSVSDVLTPALLLGLLAWSRSKRFRDELPGTGS